MNNMREESRQILKKILGANERDALIFVGSGATSAINMLVSKLGLRELVQQAKQNNSVLPFISENPGTQGSRFTHHDSSK